MFHNYSHFLQTYFIVPPLQLFTHISLKETFYVSAAQATTYCNTGKTWSKTRRPTKPIAIGFPFILHGILGICYANANRDVKGDSEAIAGRVNHSLWRRRREPQEAAGKTLLFLAFGRIGGLNVQKTLFLPKAIVVWM